VRPEDVISRFAAGLPKFPDGRIDYTDAKEAAVLNCFVLHDGELLLLKRSEKVSHYKGLWHVVAGYLDELKPVKEKILDELREELGIPAEAIDHIELLEMRTVPDNHAKTTWLLFPSIARLKRRPEISLDWEHTEYCWIAPDRIDEFETMPGVAALARKLLYK
jgi:8-oxo-dGTP pyrophosphatase MutT (NUDIX family)